RDRVDEAVRPRVDQADRIGRLQGVRAAAPRQLEREGADARTEQESAGSDEGRTSTPQVRRYERRDPALGRRLDSRRRLELRIVLQDAALQLLQDAARLETELLVEDPAHVSKDVERFGLPPA